MLKNMEQPTVDLKEEDGAIISMKMKTLLEAVDLQEFQDLSKMKVIEQWDMVVKEDLETIKQFVKIDAKTISIGLFNMELIMEMVNVSVKTI